jgi:hypothetical protein
MVYVKYDEARVPWDIKPAWYQCSTIEEAVRYARAVIAKGGYFKLRIEAEDGHTLYTEAQIPRG